MKNHEICILHISSILANHNTFSPDEKSKAMFNVLDRGGFVGKEFDYVVVCGNITKDGTKRSFSLAGDFLHQLLFDKGLLKRGEYHNRVLIAPGPNDVSYDYESSEIRRAKYFKYYPQFYSKLFDEPESKLCISFETLTKYLKELKDLSMAALCYWDVEEQGLRNGIWRGYTEGIFSITKQALSVNYCRRYTPTLIACDCYPSIDISGIPESKKSDISKCLKCIGTQVLLFCGDGPHPLIHPQNHPYENVFTIGTRQIVDGLENLPKTNIVEIQYGPEALELKISALTKATEVLPEFAEQNHRVTRVTVPHSRTNIFDEYVAEIGKIISTEKGRLIAIRGIPGSGLWDLYGNIGETIKLNNMEFAVVKKELEISSFEDEKQVATTFRQIISNVKDKRGENVIVALADKRRVLHERICVLENIGSTLRQNLCILRAYTSAVLYFSEFRHDEYLESNGLIDEYLEIKALTNKDAEMEYVRKYEEDIPIAGPNDLRYLTGGFIGFSKELLEAAKEEFSSWCGAVALSQESIHRLFGQVLKDAKYSTKSNVLSDHIKRFLYWFEKYPDGKEILYYIRSLVISEKVEEAIRDGKKPSQIQITKVPPNCEGNLAFLRAYGVVKSGQKGKYDLELMAPFIAWPIANKRVFLSFASEYKKQAGEIEKYLVLNGVQPYYYLKPSHHDVGEPVTPILDNRLRELNNFVLIYGDFQTFDGKPILRYEWEQWKENWYEKMQIGKAKRMVILLSDDEKRPPDLDFGIPIWASEYNNDMARIAKELSYALVEYEPPA
jgi:hypothetical protein